MSAAETKPESSGIGGHLVSARMKRLVTQNKWRRRQKMLGGKVSRSVSKGEALEATNAHIQAALGCEKGMNTLIPIAKAKPWESWI